MIRLFCLAILALIVIPQVFCQNVAIRVRAVNGKSGKPFVHQRLLFFGGASPEEATEQVAAFDITTDAKGDASLFVDPSKVTFLNVFPDFMTLCARDPNHLYLDVGKIIAEGLIAPNNCGLVTTVRHPDELSVYARRPTPGEKTA